jgi:hypothetical protein
MSVINGDAVVFTDLHKEEKYESMIPGLFIHTRSDTFPNVIKNVVRRQEILKEKGKTQKFYVIVDLDKIELATVDALDGIPNDLNIIKVDATHCKTPIASITLSKDMTRFAEQVSRK